MSYQLGSFVCIGIDAVAVDTLVFQPSKDRKSFGCKPVTVSNKNKVKGTFIVLESDFDDEYSFQRESKKGTMMLFLILFSGWIQFLFRKEE